MAWVRCCGSGNNIPILPRPLTLSELVGNYAQGAPSKVSYEFKVASTDILTITGYSNYNNTVIGVDISVDNGATWTRLSNNTMTSANTGYTFNIPLSTYAYKVVRIRLSYSYLGSAHDVHITNASVN